MLLHLYAVSVVSLVTLGIGLGLVYGTPSVMGTLDEVKSSTFNTLRCRSILLETPLKTECAVFVSSRPIVCHFALRERFVPKINAFSGPGKTVIYICDALKYFHFPIIKHIYLCF